MPAEKPWIKRRHRIVQGLARYPAKLFFYLLYRFRGARFSPGDSQPPYLILSNHNSPLDPVCLGTSFYFPIYYLASDHIFRLGWISSLLRFLVAPIPILKSSLDIRAIRDMMRIIGKGGSVCLFPEGNRSFTGETGPITPAVAKLARSLKATLLLYRIEGGYLTTPRWGDGIRRGRMTGRVSRVVTPEEMAEMGDTALHELIRRELWEDAYARQQEQPVRHRCRAPARALERALYLCPGCGGMATLKSAGDRFGCVCGLSVRLDPFGFFQAENGGIPFRTVAQWHDWQRQQMDVWLQSRLREAGHGQPILSDDGQEFLSCARAGANERLGEGRLALYGDRISLEMAGSFLEIPLSAVERLIVHGKQTLQLTEAGGATYEIRSPHPRSPLKYLHAVQWLISGKKEATDGFFSR